MTVAEAPASAELETYDEDEIAAAMASYEAHLTADYDRSIRSHSSAVDPLTDQDLWRWIKYHAGGLRRSRDYWDARLTWRENRAAFRYLDRGWTKGRKMDELAQEIGSEWPHYGITDTESLWEWLQRTRRC